LQIKSIYEYRERLRGQDDIFGYNRRYRANLQCGCEWLRLAARCARYQSALVQHIVTLQVRKAAERLQRDTEREGDLARAGELLDLARRLLAATPHTAAQPGAAHDRARRRSR
jgi:hypothetical protein